LIQFLIIWFLQVKLNIWDPEKDLYLIEKCVDQEFSILNLQMPNRTLLNMRMCLILLKEYFGFKYDDILAKCKENLQEKEKSKWPFTHDHSSRKGLKWIKAEDEFLKECEKKKLTKEK
jgi:hypothetical protein